MATASNRQSYWSFMITLPHGGGCSGGRNTSAEALADAIKDCTYYLGNYPSVQIELTEHCDRCQGNGDIAGKRRFSRKPCPVCKGQPDFQKIGPIAVQASDNVKVMATC